MTRLIRPLTVVVGILIAIAGGAFVLIRSTGRATPAAAGAAQQDTTTSAAPAGSTTSAGLSSPATTTTTTAVTSTTLSPLATLTTTLNATLAGSNSCLAVQDASGRTLYQHQPDAALIPASTQKLLVAAAALTTLGPNFRFTTQVAAPAAPVNGKVAALWLVGNGDPLLAAPEFIASTVGRVRVAGYPWTPLTSLADSLAATGIKSVAGGIRGDDSHQDRLRFLPVWPALYQTQEQVGQLSALSVNEGIQYTPPKSTLTQDPPNYAAAELARLLQQRKVAVASEPDQTATAGAVVVASVSSAPLSQIVEAMLRASDNWIAELLVRAIDQASGGTGTTAGGIAIVLRQAAQARIPLAGVHMDDGSGLSRSNRATCGELLAALDLGLQPAYAPLLSGLAVAGQTGTLATRYRGTAVAGKLQAKTGSLDNAGGMVGVMSVKATSRFAFLDNDTEAESALLAREDAVVAALAAYPGGP